MPRRTDSINRLLLAGLSTALALGCQTTQVCAATPGNTNFIPSAAARRERIKHELTATKPDFVVFVPRVTHE